MRAIDQDNITRMRELLKQYGWPGPELIGNDGTLAAWLLVQHSDIDLQSLTMLPSSTMHSWPRSYRVHAMLSCRIACLSAMGSPRYTVRRVNHSMN